MLINEPVVTRKRLSGYLGLHRATLSRAAARGDAPEGVYLPDTGGPIKGFCYTRQLAEVVAAHYRWIDPLPDSLFEPAPAPPVESRPFAPLNIGLKAARISTLLTTLARTQAALADLGVDITLPVLQPSHTHEPVNEPSPQ